MKELVSAIVIAAIVAVVTLTVVEIGSSDDGELAALATSSPSPSAVASPSVVTNGAQLFVSSGCAACHGANAEGGVGPALAGHTAEQVIRQARRPLNVMPIFTADELSAEDLDQIAMFIADLPSGMAAHEEPMEGLDPRDVIAMHHWMALSALRAGNPDAAATHVAAVIEAVGGEHEAAMIEAAAALEAGDPSTAEAIVVEMLAGFVPDLTDEQILLRLALQALAVDDLAEAIADVESAIELADADRVPDLQSALDALRRGDTAEAEALISPLSGLPEHEVEDTHTPADEAAGDDG